MKEKQKPEVTTATNEIKTSQEEPEVLEEIVIEEMSIDGVCGVY